MKILNLYAGIGGNRKLWGDEHEITAVELVPRIAKIYQGFFPKDKVIIADAHQYLLDHYKEFDFIWSSPPCPTHSITNHFLNAQGKIRYPDMCLYQEIIFLSIFFKGKYCVENVKSYYPPLIKPQYAGRHAFWTNFKIDNFRTPNNTVGSFHHNTIKRKIAAKKSIEQRNMVYPPLGLFILNMAYKEKQETLEFKEIGGI